MNSFIPKTGIQYFRWKWEFGDVNIDIIKLDYIDYWDQDNFYWICKEIVRIDKKWYKLSELIELNLVDPSMPNQWRVGAEQGVIDGIQIVEDHERKSLSGSLHSLTKFKNKWLPFPMVAKDHFGPERDIHPALTPRVFFDIVDGDIMDLVIAIDTDKIESTADSKEFVIGPYEFHVQQLINGLVGVDTIDYSWLPDYLQTLYKESGRDNADDKSKFMASYLMILKTLEKCGSNIGIKFEGNTTQDVVVNAFIDVGNTSTSVSIQEMDTAGNAMADFKKLKQLEITQFSTPLITKNHPFSTTAVFHKPQFLSNEYEISGGDSFHWKSPLRLGDEASRLMSRESLSNAANSKPIGISSPKRYLWDKTARSEEWVFCSEGRKASPIPVMWPGITTRLDASGMLPPPHADQEVGALSTYSRSSITTFVFLEIICHLYRQINSLEFREAHGDQGRKRILNQVVITCPTGMSQEEQISLRTSFKDAVNLFFGHSESGPTMIPSLKDVKLDITELGERDSWMYDEATTSQLLWLYSEVVHKFDKNVDAMLKSYDADNDRPLRVASIDVGGGTTDFMLCDYDLTRREDVAHVTPSPVFWDSIYNAGDDLKRDLLFRIAIKGTISSFGTDHQIPEMQTRLVQFFSTDSNAQDATSRAMRIGFINQIGKVLVSKYLDDANQDQVKVYSFQDLFQEGQIDEVLLAFFSKRFGFSIEDIVWESDPNVINQIITSFFQKQMRTLASLIYKANPDVVVLTGGTFKLNSLDSMFASASGLPISRIVNLNKIKIGNWFPYVDGQGKLTSSKSIVSVGSAVAFFAEKNQLVGFNIDTSKLKTEIKSKSKYLYDDNNELFNPSRNRVSITVNQLPIRLTTSPLSSPNYLRKPSYKLDFDRKGLRRYLEKVKEFQNIAELNQAIENKIIGILGQAPFDINIERIGGGSLEKIDVESVTAGLAEDKEDINEDFFKVTCETLPEGKYWLESGFKFN